VLLRDILISCQRLLLLASSLLRRRRVRHFLLLAMHLAWCRIQLLSNVQKVGARRCSTLLMVRERIPQSIPRLASRISLGSASLGTPWEAWRPSLPRLSQGGTATTPSRRWSRSIRTSFGSQTSLCQLFSQVAQRTRLGPSVGQPNVRFSCHREHQGELCDQGGRAYRDDGKQHAHGIAAMAEQRGCCRGSVPCLPCAERRLRWNLRRVRPGAVQPWMARQGGHYFGHMRDQELFAISIGCLRCCCLRSCLHVCAGAP